MLHTIREYALERLAASGSEAETRRSHAHYFIELAERLEPEVLGVDPLKALDLLSAEHDNLVGALEWLHEVGNGELAMPLAGALWEFWCLTSRHVDGLHLLQKVACLDGPGKHRAKIATGVAHLAFGAGADAMTLRGYVLTALELQREYGDAWNVAFAESEYGLAFTAEGDFASALPLMEKSVRCWQELGDEHRELQAMRIVAWAASELGDPSRYRSLHEEIVRRARLIGDREGESWSLACLGGVARDDGDYQTAIDLLIEAHHVGSTQELGLVGMVLVRVATVLAYAARPAAAAQLFGRAAAIHEQVAFVYPPWFAAIRDDGLARIRTQLDDESIAQQMAAGALLADRQALAMARQAVATADVPA